MVGRPVGPLTAGLLGAIALFFSGVIVLLVRAIIENAPLTLTSEGFHAARWKRAIRWDQVSEFKARRLWMPPFVSQIEFKVAQADGQVVDGLIADSFRISAKSVAEELNRSRQQALCNATS